MAIDSHPSLPRSTVIFILSLICGFFLPQGLFIGKLFILPALTVIIIIHLLRFPEGFFSKPFSLFYSSLHGNLMNYVILGNFIILAGAFLIERQELWVGTVLIAAMPASLESMIFLNSPHIDKNSLLNGVSGTYFGAIFFTAIAGFCFLKYAQINAWNITLLILLLIFLPITLSQLIVEKKWTQIIGPYEEILLDISSLIVFYAIAASTKNYLKKISTDTVMLIVIALVSTIVIDFGIRKIDSYFFHEHDDQLNTLVLLGTMKNCGLAGGIALTLFNPEVAVPTLIFAIFTFVNLLFLHYQMNRAS